MLSHSGKIAKVRLRDILMFSSKSENWKLFFLEEESKLCLEVVSQKISMLDFNHVNVLHKKPKQKKKGQKEYVNLDLNKNQWRWKISS